MILKTWRDPYDIGYSITKKREIELYPGLTVLVGCNGAGKTTLLYNIEEQARDEKIPCHKFDNLSDGGASSCLGSIIGGYREYDCDSLDLGALILNSSEGESIKMNIYRQSTLYNEFLKTGYFKSNKYSFSRIFGGSSEEIEDQRRIFLYDATDSGMSIDAVIELKEIFKALLKKSEQMGIETYIIISANEYELADNENCLDVQTGEYISFEDYTSYKKFILSTRALKEKRIQKSQEFLKRRHEKEVIKQKNILQKNTIKISEIENHAKEKNRELTWNEKNRIDNLKREIDQATKFLKDNHEDI